MNPLRVIACASFPRKGASALHNLARALRDGDAAAVDAAARILGDGLAREAPDLAAALDATVVPMAGHTAGSTSGPAVRLAVRLVEAHPGWTLAAALERTLDAPAARAAGARDPDAEAGTLRWREPAGSGPVILVDDVVHTGASLEAAWTAAPPGLRARLVGLVAFRAA